MSDLFETTPQVTLDTFVGEGKKYKDNDAVAKALVEKDNFIARVLEEKRQLEADHRAALNQKAFDDRIKALEQAQTLQPEPSVTQVAPPTPNVDIEDVVQKAIAQREAQNLRTRNLMEVKDKLIETLGDDYANKVKNRAQELHISMEKLNEMAADAPNAFFALIGLAPRAQSMEVAPPATRHNAAAFAPTTTEKANAFYSQLRKEKPTEYWSPRVQMEEYNQLKKLGPEKFYAS
jgi:hypothetical protein